MIMSANLRGKCILAPWPTSGFGTYGACLDASSWDDALRWQAVSLTQRHALNSAPAAQAMMAMQIARIAMVQVSRRTRRPFPLSARPPQQRRNGKGASHRDDHRPTDTPRDTDNRNKPGELACL